MPTIHGNVPEDRAETEVMDHLTMQGLNPAIIDYIRLNDVRQEVEIKSACGMKVIITLTRSGLDVRFA